MEKAVNHQDEKNYPPGIIKGLVLSAIYKLSTNEQYDMAGESKIYKEVLESKGIYTKRTFEDYFMTLMADGDPFAIKMGLGLHLGEPVLNPDKTFISDSMRRNTAEEGRRRKVIGLKPV